MVRWKDPNSLIVSGKVGATFGATSRRLRAREKLYAGIGNLEWSSALSASVQATSTPPFISRPRQQGRRSAALPARAAGTGNRHIKRSLLVRSEPAPLRAGKGAAPGVQRLERGPSGAKKTPKVDPYNDNQFQDVSAMGRSCDGIGTA